MSSNDLRICLCQITSIPGNVQENLTKAIALLRTRHNEADLFVFPEMYLHGYGGDYNVKSLAEPQDGPSYQTFKQHAQELGIYILYGYAEVGVVEGNENPNYYISSQLVSPNCDEPSVNYRKINLYTPSGFEVNNFSFGPTAALSTATAVLKGRRVGLLICFDIEFPEPLRYHRKHNDVTLALCIGANGDSFVMTHTMAVRAFENQCYALYVNHPKSATTTFCGLSGVWAPTGKSLALLKADEDVQIVTVPFEDPPEVVDSMLHNPYLKELKTYQQPPPSASGWAVPPVLQTGDCIAVVAPSSGAAAVFPTVYRHGIERLKAFGFTVLEMPSTTLTDDALDPVLRANEINQAFLNKEVKAVICTIGGNDQIRVLPHLNLDAIRNNPKIFMGFSDCTSLHLILWNLGIQSYYGGAVMTQWAWHGDVLPPYTEESLRNALFRSGRCESVVPAPGHTDEDWDWRDSSLLSKQRVIADMGITTFEWGNEALLLPEYKRIEGRLWGGCLEVLEQHFLVQTYLPSDERLNGCVLFLETSEELPCAGQVYRFLAGLGHKGVLQRFRAILMGIPKTSFLGNTPAGGSDAYRAGQKNAVMEAMKHSGVETKCPVVFDLNIGHTHPQLVVPMGGMVCMDVNEKRISFL